MEWWRESLRHVATSSLEDELDYLRREYAALRALQRGSAQSEIDAQRYDELLQRGRMLRSELNHRYATARIVSEQQRPDYAEFAHELKRRAALHEYVALDVRTIKRLGSMYVASCPFHEDDTPSFTIWESPSPHFFCFGCGLHGDIFDYLEARGLAQNWRHAVEILAEQLHVQLPTAGPRPIWQTYSQ